MDVLPFVLKLVWKTITHPFIYLCVIIITSWTEVGDLNSSRYSMAGSGTTTSALVFGGYSTAQQALTESWNGSAWTEVADISTRYNLAGAGISNTSALAFGGQPGTGGSSAKTEEWTGSSWTELNDLNTARVGLGGAGTTESALAFGGEGPPSLASTEEWNVPANTTVTFTVS